MRILQVSTADIAGGAETVARRLCGEYRRLGHNSWLAVGLRYSTDPDVLLIPNAKPKKIWSRLCMSVATSLNPLFERTKGGRRAQQLLEKLAEPLGWLKSELGYEDFAFPGSWRLLDLPPQRPDIVHCHNLHGPFVPGGGYFDLRILPWLSRQVPVILTLHDGWLLTGHCAHMFDCERWKIGCGQCPDLKIYPAISRDSTDYNWRKKKEIYSESRVFVSSPSRWLMEKVEQSILACAGIEYRIIPNGVDLSIFKPADRHVVREELDIRTNAKVLLFVANTIRHNSWKDYKTMRLAVARVAECLPRHDILFMALGEDAPSERIGQGEIRFVPYQNDLETVARYYQAADIYIHAVKADTFPTTVLESLACGTPVVATAVGGIPEQVKGLNVEACGFRFARSELNGYESDEATGILVRPGAAEAMAKAIVILLDNESQRRRLGENAAMDARRRFALNRQVNEYLRWYHEIKEHWEWIVKTRS